MTRTIKLKGRMGELFGEEHRLNVKTIQEAMHAIDVMKGGLRRYIMECTDLGIKFTVQRGSEVKAYAKENIDDFIGEDEIGNILDDDDIIITPVPAGALLGKIFKAVFKVIAGALLIWGAIVTGGALGVVLGAMGAMLALQGIIEMMTPDADQNDEPEKSSLFNGPVNTTKVGVPVPMAYGRVECGGVVTNFGFTKARKTSSTGYTKDAFGDVNFEA